MLPRFNPATSPEVNVPDEKSSCVKLGSELFEGVLSTLYIIAVYASYLFNGLYLELFSIKKLDNTKCEGVRVNLFNFCRDGF